MIILSNVLYKSIKCSFKISSHLPDIHLFILSAFKFSSGNEGIFITLSAFIIRDLFSSVITYIHYFHNGVLNVFVKILPSVSKNVNFIHFSSVFLCIVFALTRCFFLVCLLQVFVSHSTHCLL